MVALLNKYIYKIKNTNTPPKGMIRSIQETPGNPLSHKYAKSPAQNKTIIMLISKDVTLTSTTVRTSGNKRDIPIYSFAGVHISATEGKFPDIR
jgi:hypothetical protein